MFTFDPCWRLESQHKSNQRAQIIPIYQRVEMEQIPAVCYS
jgi:hypothetical protein